MDDDEWACLTPLLDRIRAARNVAPARQVPHSPGWAWPADGRLSRYALPDHDQCKTGALPEASAGRLCPPSAEACLVPSHVITSPPAGRGDRPRRPSLCCCYPGVIGGPGLWQGLRPAPAAGKAALCC